jgi:hypothetical protein
VPAVEVVEVVEAVEAVAEVGAGAAGGVADGVAAESGGTPASASVRATGSSRT